MNSLIITQEKHKDDVWKRINVDPSTHTAMEA